MSDWRVFVRAGGETKTDAYYLPKGAKKVFDVERGSYVDVAYCDSNGELWPSTYQHIKVPRDCKLTSMTYQVLDRTGVTTWFWPAFKLDFLEGVKQKKIVAYSNVTPDPLQCANEAEQKEKLKGGYCA
eukprot:CAMPEP_0114651744 /NCGR_PEP_ID=MMETSP0191-20121206/8541_1 /TAXON_ID=126664 /ORGANISM="Sorites sp." /LENGTH=127 /DNA_ID=CAMNT_0001866047 /DNA_START=105 /DNA_END=488 /DNA_ORIENTATION=-